MTIRHFLEETVARHAQCDAVQFRAGDRIVTRSYAELAARARQVAELAGAVGLAPRQAPAGLLLENSPEWIEIYLGLAACGIAVVPLDPKLRSAEIVYMLQDAGVAALFTDKRHLPLFAKLDNALPALCQFVVTDADAPGECAGRPCHAYAAGLAAHAAAAAGPASRFASLVARPGDIASLIYTSGTTGRPKGAMLTHANFCADTDGALQVVSEIGAEDRFLIVLPLFHSFSFTANFMVPLRVGACMQFVSNLRSVAEDLRRFSPTILMSVPLLAEKIYSKIEDGLRHNPLARLLLALGLNRFVARGVVRKLGGHLRLIVTGGAPCPPALLQGLKRLGLPVLEGYGLTETSPVVSLSRPEANRPGTIGHALPNIEVRIVDADDQGVGELQVRGPIVMRGYYNNPEATAEAFDGDWLRTGDLVSMDSDGFLAIRGRKKALIVNREGKNIYPEEVELGIARDPHILDVVVIGYHEAGDIGEKVGAIVAPNLDIFAQEGDAPPPWEEIERRVRQIVQQQCRDMADYKRPRKLDVRREPLERTSIQKVRRHIYQGQLDTR